MDHLRADEYVYDRRSAIHPGLEVYLEEPVWKAATALIGHSAFDGAMLSYCRRMVEPNGFRWPANKIFAQKLRYITCYMLIGLAVRFDQGRGPAPTMTLLQTLVPGSARQVSDLMAGLRAGGYVTAEPNSRDRREIWLRPAPALVLEIARSPLSFVAASSLIEPQSSYRRLADDTALLSQVLARSMEAFQAKDVLFAPFDTIVDFTGRDSGYLMLCAVMGAYLAQSAGERFDLPLTYDALSPRFQVSRQHVGNVLGGAIKRGLFSIRSGQIEHLDPALLREFSWWSAGQMAHFGMLAAAVCAPNPANAANSPGDLEIR